MSYWGVGLLVTIGSIALGNAIGTLVEDAHPSSAASIFFGFLTFVCAATVWQLVGIWRSAGLYISTANRPFASSRPFWGYLARFFVVLGALRAIVDFSTITGPAIQHSARLAVGRHDIAPYQLKILRNGTEVELSGAMPPGTAEALRNLLDAAPAVKLVHLNNAGGLVAEGYAVHKLVRERGLTTYTATNCVSACTIAFLGGGQRLLSSNARLGFHSISYGELDNKLLPEINADLRGTLQRHRVPDWFIVKALTTSAKEMRYPTQEELLRAAVITKIVDPNQFAISGVGAGVSENTVDEAFVKIPVYKAIKEYDQGSYKELLAHMVEGTRTGKSVIEIQRDMQQVVMASIVPKYLKLAPDRALTNYWGTQIEEMRHLMAKSPQLCVEFIHPERRSASFDLTRMLPAELLDRDLAALAVLVAEGAKSSPNVGPKASPQELEAAMTNFAAKNPESFQVLAEPEKHIGRPSAYCKAFIDLYSEVLALPAQKSGKLLRSLASAD